MANEKLSKWSNLESAKSDYTSLLSLPLSPPTLRSSIQRSLLSLEPRIAQSKQAETDEMLNKLKELGNSVLGRFGLSLDNFKVENSGDGKDGQRGKGGYSVNFSK